MGMSESVNNFDESIETRMVSSSFLSPREGICHTIFGLTMHLWGLSPVDQTLVVAA